jgi:hypothetical protein
MRNYAEELEKVKAQVLALNADAHMVVEKAPADEGWRNTHLDVLRIVGKDEEETIVWDWGVEGDPCYEAPIWQQALEYLQQEAINA